MNTTEDVSLATLNADELTRSAALLTFLCLIAATGIPGNILVCIIYRNFHATSISRFFLFWLAVNDAVNSSVVILELIVVSHPYTYPSDWLCKLTIFLEMWPTLTSGTLLSVISVDRYRKVCHPFAWQIRPNHARNIYIAIILAALVFAWPTLVLFGKREVTISPYNVTGTACLIREEYDGTLYMTIYSGLLWLIFVSVLVILVIFYALIGRRIFYQMKKSEAMQRTGSNQTMTKITPPEEPTSSESDPFRICNNVPNIAAISNSDLKPRISLISSASGRKSQRMARARRSAFIMFLISLVFVVSFVPYLSLRLVEALDKGYVPGLTDGGRAAFNFFLRCYFLNCAVNPFIYGACVSQFREDVRSLFGRLINRN